MTVRMGLYLINIYVSLNGIPFFWCPDMSTSKSPDRRPRGRPAKTDAQMEEVRLNILAATRQVFARTGFHGLSVELILAESGISRPTFYKYFRSAAEPIDQVLSDVNQQLVEALLRSADPTQDIYAQLEQALLVWRDWGKSLGPMLKPLFEELHDAWSPASRHRRRTLSLITEAVAAMLQAAGRECPSRTRLDTLVNGVEYLGYRYHLETPADDKSWKETRDTMICLALGLLGTAEDWARVPELASRLNIAFESERAP